MLTRNRLVVALCLIAAAVAWNTISVQELATLHVPAGESSDDHYARVWVVDARPFVWIRAEAPTRRWLEPLRENPDVFLWRGDQRIAYRAHIWENEEARAKVDALFREKYGTVDAARALLRRNPTVPIRLDPR